MDESGSRVVLVVEDEQNLAALYTTWLNDQYDVRTATDGEEALQEMDDTVDVVLLDRRLPGMSGDEFLAAVRADGYDCRIAMVSAVDPDFDIVEMGFDDYVVKPVERKDLLTVIERLATLDEVSPDSREYFRLLAKKEALESQKSKAELTDSQEYADLVRSVESFRKHVISLAQTYLVANTDWDSETRVYQEGIEEWQRRQRDLDESDPLYRTAQQEIKTYEQRLEDADRPDQPEQELLEIVAEGYVAEGFWLDRRVRRALNEIFFEKHTDTFVINQQQLDPDADLSPKQLFEVSQAVRERAADH